MAVPKRTRKTAAESDAEYLDRVLLVAAALTPQGVENDGSWAEVYGARIAVCAMTLVDECTRLVQERRRMIVKAAAAAREAVTPTE